MLGALHSAIVGRQQPPAGRLELRHGVVVDARPAVDGGLEADVDVGREAVGGGRLGGGVGLVRGGDGGAALSERLHQPP